MFETYIVGIKFMMDSTDTARSDEIISMTGINWLACVLEATRQGWDDDQSLCKLILRNDTRSSVPGEPIAADRAKSTTFQMVVIIPDPSPIFDESSSRIKQTRNAEIPQAATGRPEDLLQTD
jgi:hypothetical protein